MRSYRFAFTVMLSMALLLTPCAWAQENATIAGTVMDSTNAVVPNAEITLTNTATSQERKATSNNEGIYLFVNVGVGKFTLSTTAKGFQKYTKTDIVVNTAQTLKEDIILTVGSEAQTITVEADALRAPVGDQRGKQPDQRCPGDPTGDQWPQCGLSLRPWAWACPTTCRLLVASML